MVKLNGIEIDGRKVAGIIKFQPGYTGDGEYMIAKATTGGYRLYKHVSGNWMDASLGDVPDLAMYAKDASALGRKGRAVNSPAQIAASKANGRKGGRPKNSA